MIVLKAQRGRITLTMTGQRMGRDLCVTLSGGDREHIGAVALCPGAPVEGGTSVLLLPGHREDELAMSIATRLAIHLDAVVCVACGIHLDAILPDEIQAVLEMSEELARELIAILDEQAQ